jgi:hypothetical protein
MVGKRGQLTIFIIIAILIVAGVALFFVFRGDVNEGESSGDVDIQNVINSVDICLEESVKQALYLIGLHGGYYSTPQESNELGVPYYLNGKTYLVPSESKIEEEISGLVISFFPDCLGNFEEIEEVDVEILKGLEVKTLMREDEIIFNLKYPLRITKGDSSSIIEKFSYSSPVRLNVLYETSKFIVNSHLKNEGGVCISCLLEYSRENQVGINMSNEGGVIIYELEDELSILSFIGDPFEDENYKFKFGVKYE